MNNRIIFNPLVTVYIPTYNRVELLQRALESVRQQTYKNIEVIVVDDCSVDGTHEYLKKIATEDSRIHYFLKEKNSGACVSRNIAIDNAKGEFITGLDDDDYFEKERIELFIKAAMNNVNEIYFSSVKLKISDHIIVSPSLMSFLKFSKIKNCNKLLNQNLIGNQIFIRTDIMRKSGGFDEELKAWQDLECWFNLMKSQNIKANLIKIPTQVIDISHEHERITKKNITNIIDSYEYIVKKYNLGPLERFALKGQLVNYKSENFSFSHKLLLFVYTRQLYYLKMLF